MAITLDISSEPRPPRRWPKNALRYCPLYRQSAILTRETGIDLSRATLDGWVMRVGELLRPISGAMAQELLAGNYIQADETPVGVQSESFRMGREREGPRRFLGNFEGILQSDGYAAYDHVGGPNIVHAACYRARQTQIFPGGRAQS